MNVPHPKPLAYESLKIVMQYMDPNKRFLTTMQIPSIRTTDRIVPLKIAKLGLGASRYDINGTTYTFGIIREIPGGTLPQEVQRENEEGGAIYDMNEYGGSLILEKIGWAPETTIGGVRQIYQRSVQMTITPPSRDPLIYRFPYNVPFQEAIKKINLAFFGDRRLIRIRHFEYLNLYHMEFRDGLLYIGDLVETCKRLVIDYCRDNLADLILCHLPNQEVLFRSKSDWINAGNFSDIVGYWKAKPMGMCYWVGINEKSVAVDLLKLLVENHNGKRRGERQVMIPNNELSKMSVSYDAALPTDPSKWILKFQMLPVQFSMSKGFY